MGLDIALGLLVLIGALRGWFKGFLLQAIRLAALVGCIFLADPIRDVVRPYAHDYFPGVRVEILDKLLWWTAAVLAYVVTSGLAIGLVKLSRRKTVDEVAVPNRSDQGAGFLLGGLKAGLLAVFVAAGITQYLPGYLKPKTWLAEQVATSRVLRLCREHRPAEQIWASPPVQTLVKRVRQRGFWADEPAPVGAPLEGRAPDRDPVATSRLPRTLQVPRPLPLDPASPTFLRDLDRELAREGKPR